MCRVRVMESIESHQNWQHRQYHLVTKQDDVGDGLFELCISYVAQYWFASLNVLMCIYGNALPRQKYMLTFPSTSTVTFTEDL